MGAAVHDRKRNAVAFRADISYQQEIKRDRREHLISSDMITKKSESAQCDRREATGFLRLESRKSSAAGGSI